MIRAILVATIVSVYLTVSAPEARAQSKTGEAKFTQGGSEAVNVAVGEKVKLTASFKVIPVGTLTAVSVKGDVQNTAAVKMFYSYNVAFMDKDKNLIGCQNFSLFLAPGKQGQTGTFITLPPAQISRIAYYSVALLIAVWSGATFADW